MTRPNIRHLDLFSGIGGFALAAQMVGGIETRQFVEIDPFCQKNLAKNFRGVPIHADVTTFTADRGSFDLITGGFPCQDISSANPNGRGLEGDRSGLFYEIIRLVCQCKPRYLLLENVAAMLTKRRGRTMGTVLWWLSESGYDAEWQVISAASLGAPHVRERLFIIAYSHSHRCYDGMAVTGNTRKIYSRKKARNPWEASEASLLYSRLLQPLPLRMANGIPNRVDRIRSLGNAVVPQAAMIPLLRILEIDRSHSEKCDRQKS